MNCFGFLHEISCTTYCTSFQIYWLLLAAPEDSFADKLGGKYCTEDWGPANVAKTTEDTVDECMARCLNDNSCQAITYANEINPTYHKDCMLCVGTAVSSSSGYDTYLKEGKIFFK